MLRILITEITPMRFKNFSYDVLNILFSVISPPKQYCLMGVFNVLMDDYHISV